VVRRPATVRYVNSTVDDRDPQECRFLLRLWWQLAMSYQEVSMDELGRNVGKLKLDVIEALIGSIRSSHAEVVVWIARTQRAFPVIQDRGFRATRDADSRRGRGFFSRRRQMMLQARLRRASWMSSRISRRILRPISPGVIQPPRRSFREEF